MRTTIIRLLAALAIAVLGASPLAAQPAPDRVRLALNPGSYAYLPIFWAVDHGYFAAQHLDVQVSKYTGSSLTQLPSMARGDLDIAPVVAGPGLFNQLAQGFALKIVSSIDQSQRGWHDTGCLLVRADLWDSGAIRKIGDLRGKVVDGGLDGTAQNYLLKQAILQGGLTLGDMTYTEKFKTIPDMFAALRNHATDVVGNAEPVCTQMQAQGLAHKWLTFQDATPRMQGAFITTSAAYIKDHRDVVKRFLMALLRAEQDIKKSNGSWTPALISTVSHWSEIPEATIATIPGPSYSGQFGLIDLDALIKQQLFWFNEGSVKQRVAVTDLVDTTILTDARRELGIKN